LPTVVAVLRKMPGIVLRVFLPVKVLIIALFVDKQQTAKVSRWIRNTLEKQSTYAVRVA
jgi:hypothetical protein